MRTKTRLVIIFLAVIALIAFNMAPVAFAKKGGRGDRGGGDGGRMDGGGSSSSARGSASTRSQGGSRAEADEASPGDGAVDEASPDEADDPAASRERRGFRSAHRHRHGGMREISEADVVARAEQRAENLFDNLDTNEDGVVDADEVAAASEERAQRIYDRLADKFGETETGIEVDPESRMGERLGDIAADGVVTLDELKAETADGLNEFDQDGDGTITADELSAELVENATERFDERDTNDDGVIDAADRDSGEAEAEDEAGEEEEPIEE
jgi:Ca2+-binding EF-hand superfamily protein